MVTDRNQREENNLIKFFSMVLALLLTFASLTGIALADKPEDKGKPVAVEQQDKGKDHAPGQQKKDDVSAPAPEGKKEVAPAEAEKPKAGANQPGEFDGPAVQPDRGDGGKPADGSVGNADNKNPPGQSKDDKNNGYECDGNNGIGKGNPAHTGCKPAVVVPPKDKPPVVTPPTEKPPVVTPPTEKPPVVEEPPVLIPPVVIDKPGTDEDFCLDHPKGECKPGDETSVVTPYVPAPADEGVASYTVVKAKALPYTGSSVGKIATFAIGIIIIGAIALALTRRR